MKAVKMIHYQGFKKPWNAEKEFTIGPDKIETLLQGKEKISTHWIENTRIVLKSSWDKLQLTNHIQG